MSNNMSNVKCAWCEEIYNVSDFCCPRCHQQEYTNVISCSTQKRGARAKKPPLGVTPQWMHLEQRIETLKEATLSYVLNGLHVPVEWVKEYNSLLIQLKELRNGVINDKLK